jgi:hypothetical protein
MRSLRYAIERQTMQTVMIANSARDRLAQLHR